MEHGQLRDREDLQLPDDLLADVLGRLPLRYLAASRCIRKAWRRVVDERHLLRTDLLPLSLAGIFIQFDCHGYPEFFSRPSSVAVNTKLDFLPPTEYPFGEISEGFDEDYFLKDHCNGLLLTSKRYVVNPATRYWNLLSTPSRPLTDPRIISFYDKCLSFDPMVSPHYHVFSIPNLKYLKEGEDVDPLVKKSEWPPSTWVLNVFSSRLDVWEERSFSREGNSALSIAEARPHFGLPACSGCYWRQALYVNCQTKFIARISLSEDKYRVIKPPPMNKDASRDHLGRSKGGVYYVSFIKDVFRVWILDESDDQIKWILKGEYDLKGLHALDQHVHGPWILEDINYELFRSQLPAVSEKASVAETFEWNSDSDDDVGDNKDGVVGERRHGCDVLGFRPFKEILFLSSFKEDEWDATVHDYHLNSSKVECLGNMRPAHYDLFENDPLRCYWREYKYFPYTPCWINEFPSTHM